MSDATLEERAAENRAFWCKVSLGILGLLCAANIFVLLFIVPKFAQIYADAFPGMTLPKVTEFINRERLPLILFTLALAIPALLMFWRGRPYAILWINLWIIWFFLQGGITVVALFLPMLHAGDIYGMPDAGR
jgi:hypothetical protein